MRYDVPEECRGNRKQNHVRESCDHGNTVGLDRSRDDLVDDRIGSSILSFGGVQIITHSERKAKISFEGM